MTWTAVPVDGTKSVKFNKTAVNNNAAYIRSTLKVDHFFDESANKDGHHNFVQMPNQTSDVAIGTEMDAVAYIKDLDINGSTAEPVLFFRNGTSINILPSVRVAALYNGIADTLTWSYNLTSITKVGTGQYTILFPDLTNTNYLILPYLNSVTDEVNPFVKIIDKKSFTFEVKNKGGNATDVVSVGFIIIGG